MRKLLVAMVVVIVWGLGVFDHALARYGLASHECATNGLGVTFCGEELERYRREVVEPMRDAGRELDELRAGLER